MASLEEKIKEAVLENLGIISEFDFSVDGDYRYEADKDHFLNVHYAPEHNRIDVHFTIENFDPSLLRQVSGDSVSGMVLFHSDVERFNRLITWYNTVNSPFDDNILQYRVEVTNPNGESLTIETGVPFESEVYWEIQDPEGKRKDQDTIKDYFGTQFSRTELWLELLGKTSLEGIEDIRGMRLPFLTNLPRLLSRGIFPTPFRPQPSATFEYMFRRAGYESHAELTFDENINYDTDEVSISARTENGITIDAMYKPRECYFWVRINPDQMGKGHLENLLKDLRILPEEL